MSNNCRLVVLVLIVKYKLFHYKYFLFNYFFFCSFTKDFEGRPRDRDRHDDCNSLLPQR